MSLVFHFSAGDSIDGCVGLAASIVADSRAAALERLRALLPGEIELDFVGNMQAGEYVSVYLNPDALTVEDIDDEYEAD